MKQGNQLAFKQLYHAYWDKLYAYSYNILNDTFLAEDVLHEVFTQIWTKREQLEIQNLKSYLFNAVRNWALLKIRDDKFTALDETIISKLDFDPEIEQQFDRTDTVLAIENAAKSLPARCRAIFYMSKFQNYSSAEIAVHFNISQRTVENQISLAIKHLRKELGTAWLFMVFTNLF